MPVTAVATSPAPAPAAASPPDPRIVRDRRRIRFAGWIDLLMLAGFLALLASNGFRTTPSLEMAIRLGIAAAAVCGTLAGGWILGLFGGVLFCRAIWTVGEILSGHATSGPAISVVYLAHLIPSIVYLRGGLAAFRLIRVADREDAAVVAQKRQARRRRKSTSARFPSPATALVGGSAPQAGDPARQPVSQDDLRLAP